MRHIGDVIRARREAKRWTLGQLARYSGVAKSALSRVENHEQYDLAPHNKARVAQAFGITVEELEADAGRTDSTPPGPSVEEIIARDRNLEDWQKEALLMHYRSFVRRR